MPLSAFSSQPITRAGAVRAFGAASAAAILAPGVVGAADIEIVPIIGCPTDRSAVLHVHVGRESEVRVDLPGATSGTPQLGAPAIARPGYPASIMIDGLEAGTRTPYQVWFRNDATGTLLTGFIVAGMTVGWRAVFAYLTHDRATLEFDGPDFDRLIADIEADG